MIGAVHILVAAALATVVTAGRVFVDLVPQDRLPIRDHLTRYTVIDAVPTLSVCGDDGLDTAQFRVQVDVISPVDLGKPVHLQIVTAVVAAMGATEPAAVLDAYGETVDTETNCYRTRIDYLIGFSTTTA